MFEGLEQMLPDEFNALPPNMRFKIRHLLVKAYCKGVDDAHLYWGDMNDKWLKQEVDDGSKTL